MYNGIFKSSYSYPQGGATKTMWFFLYRTSYPLCSAFVTARSVFFQNRLEMLIGSPTELEINLK